MLKGETAEAIINFQKAQKLYTLQGDMAEAKRLSNLLKSLKQQLAE